MTDSSAMENTGDYHRLFTALSALGTHMRIEVRNSSRPSQPYDQEPRFRKSRGLPASVTAVLC